jgi:hypothetical protein
MAAPKHEMSNVATARKRMADTISSIYDLITPGVETQTSYKILADTIGVPHHVGQSISVWMQDEGFLKVRFTARPDGTSGKASLWTLSGTKEEALKRMTTHPISRARSRFAKAKTVPVAAPTPMAAPEPEPEPKVVLASSDAEVTRAIAGPEPENPFLILRGLRKDESAALVEAARQYLDRAKLVQTKLGELEAAGIHIDMSAVKFDKDDRLETVALTLPYIGRLESEIHNYVNQIEGLRRKIADYDELRRNYNALKRRFEGEIAAKVAHG